MREGQISGCLSFAGGGDRPVTDIVKMKSNGKGGWGRRVGIRPGAGVAGAWLSDWVWSLIGRDELVEHPTVEEDGACRRSFGEVPRERATDQLLTGLRRSAYHQPLHVQGLLLFHYAFRALHTPYTTAIVLKVCVLYFAFNGYISRKQSHTPM